MRPSKLQVSHRLNLLPRCLTGPQGTKTTTGQKLCQNRAQRTTYFILTVVLTSTAAVPLETGTRSTTNATVEIFVEVVCSNVQC